MHYRKSILAVAAAAAVIALAGCSTEPSQPTSGEAGPAGLAQPGILNLCLSLSYEPLEYYENGTSGEIIGWDVDSARALADSWGVEAKVNVMDFDGLIPGLQAGRCDLVWSGMYINEDRVQVTDAVPVLQTGSQVLLAKEVAANVTEILDLCDLRIATQTGSVDNSHLQDASDECVAAGEPPIQITGYPGSVDAIASINSGKLDGLIDTTTLVATLAAKNKGLTPVPGLFSSDYWFGAFTNKDSELSSAVRDGIHALIEDGTMAELAAKYGLNPDDVATVDSKAL
ncbi:transporter substrate-binding domain-containing protein [Homoserinimonas sp. A447]